MYTGITLTYVNRTTPQQYAIVFNYFTKYDNIWNYSELFVRKSSNIMI